ncbi:MAG: cation:proton antiporter, partial [Myxococcales bacterium]|nr:cation:proton antiporter [Myxococcales bacterium]
MKKEVVAMGHSTDGSALVVLGVFLLTAYAAHALGRRMHVPRVTLLLLIGLLAGPTALDLAPREIVRWFPFVGRMALGIVGFLLGERFLGSHLRETGRVVLSVSITHAILTAATVFAALRVAGAPSPMALVLAGIATATAPAATFDLVRESGAEGPLTDTVLGVVAIDD